MYILVNQLISILFRQRFILLLFFFVFVMCEKDEKDTEIPAEKITQTIKTIIAATGGTLFTHDSIELTIPADALPLDGDVSIEQTDNDSFNIPNENLLVAGHPIKVLLPSNILFQPITLSFPVPIGSLSINDYFIFLYNGFGYFPLEYSINDGIVNVIIDIVNWQTAKTKNTNIVSEIIIIGLVLKQTPPLDEMGLKKVTVDQDGTISYSEPSAESSSKVLLLVHGWTGRPAVWDTLLTWINKETYTGYSEYWTFGYNSSWSIKKNAEILADLIKANANGAQIDIVAHSMGGLVSRSTIEQFGGARHIHKLIALGTPHKGSPLAAIRNYLGYLVGSTDPYNTVFYNYFTQGFNDLNSESVYIKEMMKLVKSPIPYYLIAGICNTDWNIEIEGPDDGIVGVASAVGIPGAITPDKPFEMPYTEAHRKMIKYAPIYDQVIDYLLTDI